MKLVRAQMFRKYRKARWWETDILYIFFIHFMNYLDSKDAISIINANREIFEENLHNLKLFRYCALITFPIV